MDLGAPAYWETRYRLEGLGTGDDCFDWYAPYRELWPWLSTLHDFSPPGASSVLHKRAARMRANDAALARFLELHSEDAKKDDTEAKDTPNILPSLPTSNAEVLARRRAQAVSKLVDDSRNELEEAIANSATGGSGATLRVLVVGVGRSDVIDILLSAGFRDIVVIDICASLIDHLRQKYTSPASNHMSKSDAAALTSGLEFVVADVRQLAEYADKSFSLILEKATLDALFCSVGYVSAIRSALKELYRVLRSDGGVCVTISHAPPMARRPYFEELSWVVDRYAVPPHIGEGLSAYLMVRDDVVDIENEKVSSNLPLNLSVDNKSANTVNSTPIGITTAGDGIGKVTSAGASGPVNKGSKTSLRGLGPSALGPGGANTQLRSTQERIPTSATQQTQNSSLGSSIGARVARSWQPAPPKTNVTAALNWLSDLVAESEDLDQ